MARYPNLSSFVQLDSEEIKNVYEMFQQWVSELILELDTRDTQVDATPSTNIYSVVTISDIGRPNAGDVAYVASTGKFKGYVSVGGTTAWQDLN